MTRTPMTHLTSTQRKQLRGLAHSLKPLVQIGRLGLTGAVLREVDHALESHELIKVKLAGDREERQEQAAQLAEETGAGLAGTVGSVAILYRRHPDPEERQIRLG